MLSYAAPMLTAAPSGHALLPRESECSDKPPPPDWEVNTCAAQFERGNCYAARGDWDFLAGMCQRTCGLCSAVPLRPASLASVFQKSVVNPMYFALFRHFPSRTLILR